jgi:hypothetical protein
VSGYLKIAGIAETDEGECIAFRYDLNIADIGSSGNIILSVWSDGTVHK